MIVKLWLPPMLLALTMGATPLAAQEWLTLETDRFTVVSDLNARDTARWARDFDRFVNGLQSLIPVNEHLMPPLTAVVFRRDGSFAPYRLRSESGVAVSTAGIFFNNQSWSLIGMPGVRGSSTDNSTIYHEAVHWYMSADRGRHPLWFSEGIAELFATFDVERGKAVIGRLLPGNISFLRATGFLPLEEFFEVTQDEAMHVNARYYPQAWLFVHYLLIGRVTDGGPALMASFLENWETMSPAAAFRATFDMDFAEMDAILRSYAGQDRMNVLEFEISEPDSAGYIVEPAPAALVELNLARLAYGTRNRELMSTHIERLLELAPESAEAYDLLAAVRLSDGDLEIEDLLDEAIARGSRDARTYEIKAALVADEVRRNEPLFRRGAYAAEDARRIANYLVSSSNLRPINLRIYTALTDALFSVGEIHDFDRIVFDNGALIYPDRGIMLIGRAALALATGETTTAEGLVEQALLEQYKLEDDEAAAARALLRRLGRD